MPITTRARRTRRGGGHGQGHVNVTPLIDIVMVLIIFYLMVGSLISSDYAEVALPMSTQGKPAAAADVYTINVMADGPPTPPGMEAPASRRTRLVIGGAETDIAGLARDLRARLARDPALVVQLRAGRDLPYRAVEPVVKAASRAGATNLRLITEQVR